MRKGIGLSVVLFVGLACGVGDTVKEVVNSVTAGEDVTTGDEALTVGEKSDADLSPEERGFANLKYDGSDLYVLKSLEAGDAACYVELDSKSMGKLEMEAGFDLCEGKYAKMVGKKVVLRTHSAKMQSPECEGNPECTKTVDKEMLRDLETW